MALELSILAAALTSCIIYIIHMNRTDMRQMKMDLTKSIHEVRDHVQACTTKIAVLEERIKINREEDRTNGK